MNLTADEWHGMTEVLFDELFQGSPVKRTKYEGLKRNLRYLSSEEGPQRRGGAEEV